ncbi:putative zinc-finger of transcription factor IIIC complex-domain-containing protein [Trametes meyenii]|nr:putative zinc-finger of transcription factor IIIC complex-domain-containing protein [Trametes meyenii]
MSEVSVFTTLGLPSVSIAPSVRGLQFSEDGQAMLLTKYAVYILTPDAGVNVELSSVMKQALDFKSPSRSPQPLGWLRTIAEFDRSLVHQWPIDCQDWGSVCLGSLDPSLQALALSPTNLTSNAGCLLALLNSNLELTIWGATRNFLTGEWAQLQDVTAVLKEAAAKVSSSALLQTLQTQSTCIEWTPQPDWGLTPAPSCDASLLVVGNRAGSVTFLRYDGAAGQMFVVNRATVSDRWVCHLAWSPWECQDGTCEAMLACAAVNGSVTILNVRQTLSVRTSDSRLSSDHELALSILPHGEFACEADGRAVTGMKWTPVHGRTPILIIHKIGTVSLWSAPSSQSRWSGRKEFALRTQKRCAGSSALFPASGICYVPNRDLAIVSLSDGSFHVVHKLSVEPTLDSPTSEAASSGVLSAASRSVFLHSEAERMTAQDVDWINGMTAYDGYSTFMWTYEASRPTDFSYKHDAKHVSTMVVAQMWDENSDERVIQTLTERVGRTKFGSVKAPIGHLRSIFLLLREPPRIARLHRRILDVLRDLPVGDTMPSYVIPQYGGDRGNKLSGEFVKSLSTHLFGWDSILCLRVRYAVAAFCQDYAVAPDIKQRFTEVASHLSRNIRAYFLLTVIRHLSAVGTLLNESDVYFARRTVLLAVTLGGFAELVQEAEALSRQFPRAPNSGNQDGQDHLDELCPACHASIPLQDAESAVCVNGHVWARCCATALLLTTPNVRTCVGCTRKAFLAAPTSEGAPVHDSGWLPNSARGSCVLRDLLEATRRCPFCGNNFVTLV